MLKNKEIAKILGISPTAVSLALNNRRGVSEETRARVLELQKYGTKANDQLWVNDEEKINKLLMIIHKSHGEIIVDKPFFSDLIESVQLGALEHNYVLEVAHVEAVDAQAYVDALNRQDYKGIILLATEMQEAEYQIYKCLNLPFILLDGSFDFECCDSVTIGDYNDIVRAFEYAYDMGHRRIGYLRSNKSISNFEHRYDGYQKALRLFSLEKDSSIVFKLSPNITGSYEDAKKLLRELDDNYEMPTCFLCDLDYIAFGAMKAFTEAGYHIPKDISIIGFDDVAACEICTPSLTTMRVNRNDLGRITVKQLLEKVENKGDYHAQLQISSELVIRNSVHKIEK